MISSFICFRQIEKIEAQHSSPQRDPKSSEDGLILQENSGDEVGKMLSVQSPKTESVKISLGLLNRMITLLCRKSET